MNPLLAEIDRMTKRLVYFENEGITGSDRFALRKDAMAILLLCRAALVEYGPDAKLTGWIQGVVMSATERNDPSLADFADASLRERIAELEKQLATALRDALRYRWLRLHAKDRNVWQPSDAPERFDATVDEAMAS